MIHNRRCVGCGNFKSRDELIKITKEHSSKKLVINPNSKIFGRSAYLCYNQSCIENALKKNKINRLLMSDEILEKDCLLRLFQD